MIQGSVKTPGVFLKAVSVLERQLFAYALGRWVNESKENKIPKYLSTVLNNQKNPEKANDLFPTAFIEWLMQNSDSVYRSFVELIDPKGEFVIIVDGNKEEINYDNIDILEHVNLLKNKGKDEKEAIKEVAKMHKIPKNEVYMKVKGDKK